MTSKQDVRLLGQIVAAAAIFVIAAGAKPSGDADDKESSLNGDKARLDLPVAKVNGDPITLGQMESAVLAQRPDLRRELLDEEKKRDFIDKMISVELMAREAERRGYDENPEVVSIKKNQLASLMHKRSAELVDEEMPSEQELRKYYEANYEKYHKPEKIRARHILLSDRDKAQELLKEVLSKKVSQYDFRRMAKENSEDEETSQRGGDLTFFTRVEERSEGDPEIEPAVVRAAFKLRKNGSVFPSLVKSPKGYHIVMRTGHRKKMDLSFEEARDRLTILVRRERRKERVEEAVSKLKERFPVELFEENLKYVVIDLSSGPPRSDTKPGLGRATRKGRRPRPRNIKVAPKRP